MGSLGRRTAATVISLFFLWLTAGNQGDRSPWVAASGQCGPNPIVCENLKPGDTDFDITGAGDPSIQGFATDISVTAGQPISFKIKTDSTHYEIAIYRLGYYNDAGARKVATLGPFTTAQPQPACTTDVTTGLADCGNWQVSASWSTAGATSGIYLAKLNRLDPVGSSHIVFVVRDDARQADVVVQTSDTTWQAYNQYGSGSLYCAGPVSNVGTVYSCPGRATKVSYNRPFDTRAHDPQSFLFSTEYPMVRFLEANGYDVKYMTGVDTERRAADLTGALKPKAFLSVGHDEYWSAGQRTAVENARAAGVSLAFFSGNEMYWKTRFEPANDGTAYRTLVGYKDTLRGAKLDPMPGVATGTWRDTRLSPPVADGGRAENGVTGTIWTVNSGTSAIIVPASMSNLRIWRNTRVAGVGGSLAPSSLGYEWDEDLDNGARPAGLVHLSSTIVPNVEKILDFGQTVGLGTATHHLTLYRDTNPVTNTSALVFGAGTVQWAWGLDGRHDDHGKSPASHTPDQAMQQATVNLLADMGAQPASLQVGADSTRPLIAFPTSPDALAPATTITAPTANATIPNGERVTIKGTASDSGGGVVAGVEVSVDGGATWLAAQGAASWGIDWSPGTLGPVTILARAIDDSGNREVATASVVVSVGAGLCPCPSLWSASTAPPVPDSDDPSALEVGLKFRSDVDGFVQGVRFYKSVNNNGTHVGNLWTSTGTRLATATFANETASGWQDVLFDLPVAILANTTYVVSYHTNDGHYSASPGYFSSLGVDRAPLHAPLAATAGGNGVFLYGATAFPTQTFNATNYWVDVRFDSTPDTSKPVIADVRATLVDSSVAVIDWSTTEDSTSRVDYSTDSAFPPAQTLSVSDAALVMSHSVRITGLRANTHYFFRLTSTDRAGNQGTWPPAGPEPPPGPGGTPIPRAFTTPAPMMRDTTATQFAAGTSTRAYVSETADGEIVLAPASGAEFSGSTLPADWSVNIWSPNGTATVNAGRLTVDGTRVAQDNIDIGPGQSVEFVATFTGDPYQHSGLGQALAALSEPFALFSTTWIDGGGAFQSGSTLAVRSHAAGAGLESNTVLGPSFLNAPHRFRIDWRKDAVVYFIDGEQVASHPVTIAGPMRPVAASDYNTFSGTIVVDWMRTTPYAADGTFVSRVFDATEVVDWDTIQWVAGTPAGTGVTIEVRTGNAAVPDGTWTNFATIAAPGPLGRRSRYIQYRAVLTSTDPTRTPELADLSISSKTNDAPAAAGDSFSVNEDALLDVPAALGVLSNDTDIQHDALTARLETPPSHGSLALRADGSFTYTPLPDYSGGDTFAYVANDGRADSTVASVAITVNQVNDAPSFAKGADQTVGEDAGPQSVPSWATAMSAGPTDEAAQTLAFLVTNSNPALFSAQPALTSAGTLTYTPAANASGSATVTVQLRDSGGTANGGVETSAAQTFTITVTPVNDRPRFTKGADQIVLEDAGAQTVAGWATGISAGAPDEAAQTLTFVVTNSNTALFSAQPGLTSGGTLTYTPAGNANGSATVTVQLRDTGGTANGGTDTSAAQTFLITVTPVNDAPRFTKGADQTVAEDAGVQSVPTWATGISAGPIDEAGQLLTFNVTGNTRPSLFAVGPAVDSTGRLTYTPAANANGSATITLTLSDNGGVANGGVATSAAQSFVISVSSRNDAPSFTKGADQTVLEDAGAQTVAAWATAMSAGPADEAGQALNFIVGNSNGALFAVQPAIAANGTLTYTPAANANGSSTVTVALHDNGGVAGGGNDTSAAQTFVITVTPVNDAPAAFNDNAATTQGVAVRIPVLANDTDPEGNAISVASVVAGTGVTVAVNADGSVTYTPAVGFVGTDTFTYKVRDGLGATSDAATVTVIVGLKSVTETAAAGGTVTTGTTAVPGDPVQSSVTSPVAATISITTGVLSESTAPDGYTLLNEQVNITVAAANGTEVVADPLNPLVLTFTIDASTIPAGETIDTLQLFRNNVILTGCPGATTIPVGQDPCVSRRAVLGGADAAGDFAFTVLTTHASRWNFGLRRVLSTPTATDDYYGVAANAALSIAAPGVLGNDLARSAMSAALVAPPASGTFKLNPSGAFTFTPLAGSCADVVFTYTATDKNGTSNIATATIAVTCAPVANGDAFDTLEDRAIGGNLLTNDARDPDVSTLQALKVTNPAHGGLTLNADGSFTYTPGADYSGADSFTYKANDGKADSNVATVTITVRPVNDAPIFTKGPDQTAAASSGARTVSAWATGISAGPNEASQTVNFVVTNDNNALFDVQPAVSPAGTLTYTPKAGVGGPARVTVLLRDDGGTADGGSDSSSAQTFTITITAPVANTPPVVSDTVKWNGDQTIVEPVAKARAAYTAEVSFTDADAGNTHTVTYSWGDATATSAGAVTEANGTGSAVGTHTYAQTGFYAVTVTVSDGIDTTTKVIKQSIIVVDPLGKYETGLGSFTSPAGSLVSNPALAGLATINALTAKHGPDGTLGYAGNTNAFRFAYGPGGLTFTGTKMSWLVVSGSKSWLKGEGNVTIAGVTQPAYYLVAAVDATASPNVDKVRVRISSKATGTVLYDTQKGAADAADATTPTPIFTTVSLK